jgi:anti-sigma B factor antagonist
MSVKITTDKRGAAIVARVQSDTLETENVGLFRTAIGPVMEQSDDVVLDLSDINFMDSTGLGAMLSCLRLMKAKGGSLKVASLTPEVRRLFDMVMMDRVFEVYPSVDAAFSN